VAWTWKGVLPNLRKISEGVGAKVWRGERESILHRQRRRRGAERYRVGLGGVSKKKDDRVHLLLVTKYQKYLIVPDSGKNLKIAFGPYLPQGERRRGYAD